MMQLISLVIYIDSFALLIAAAFLTVVDVTTVIADYACFGDDAW